MTHLTDKVARGASDSDPPVRPERTPRRRNKKRSDGLLALLFLTPLGVFYGVYYIYSFVFLGQTSRTRVSLSFADAVNVGWENFRLVATDPLFQRAILNNLLFAAIAILAAVTIGFTIAMMLATGVRAHRAMYVVFLLPSLIPLSLFATVFGKMLGSQYGAFNEALRSVGLGALATDWLASPGTAYAAVAVLLVYMVGLPVMYYRADVEEIDVSLIEAAVVDGAKTRQIFRLMLFPLMRNTHRTVILSVLLGSFRAFDLIFFSTGGAPSGDTAISGTYVYGKTLALNGVGFASAASIIVLLVAFAISGVQLVIDRRSQR